MNEGRAFDYKKVLRGLEGLEGCKQETSSMIDSLQRGLQAIQSSIVDFSHKIEHLDNLERLNEDYEQIHNQFQFHEILRALMDVGKTTLHELDAKIENYSFFDDSVDDFIYQTVESIDKHSIWIWNTVFAQKILSGKSPENFGDLKSVFPQEFVFGPAELVIDRISKLMVREFDRWCRNPQNPKSLFEQVDWALEDAIGDRRRPNELIKNLKKIVVISRTCQEIQVRMHREEVRVPQLHDLDPRRLQKILELCGTKFPNSALFNRFFYAYKDLVFSDQLKRSEVDLAQMKNVVKKLWLVTDLIWGGEGDSEARCGNATPYPPDKDEKKNCYKNSLAIYSLPRVQLDTLNRLVCLEIDLELVSNGGNDDSFSFEEDVCNLEGLLQFWLDFEDGPWCWTVKSGISPLVLIRDYLPHLKSVGRASKTCIRKLKKMHFEQREKWFDRHMQPKEDPSIQWKKILFLYIAMHFCHPKCLFVEDLIIQTFEFLAKNPSIPHDTKKSISNFFNGQNDQNTHHHPITDETLLMLLNSIKIGAIAHICKTSIQNFPSLIENINTIET